ncbi:MAG: hypothetical protein HC850_12990 [Rhodomicrobium sp.]|nr:hypothetical protein [Rhodomicrobium sp.]
MGYRDMKIATALNGDFVPAASRVEARLSANDRIEIVAPLAGATEPRKRAMSPMIDSFSVWSFGTRLDKVTTSPMPAVARSLAAIRSASSRSDARTLTMLVAVSGLRSRSRKVATDSLL